MTTHQSKQKVLIIGLGFFERELLKRISQKWETIAVDFSVDRVQTCQAHIPKVHYFTGDASSILTWKKLDLKGIRFIISTVRDQDVNLEVCRIIRDHYHLNCIIILLSYEIIDESLFKHYQAIFIKPVELGVHAIIKKMEKNVAQAINIGLGKGELVEVTIQARSHLVYRKLKYLKPANWHISALYRNDKFIIPDGNSSMQIGDKVVLAGHPKVIENVVSILIQGKPQFPSQYGNDFVCPLHPHFSDHLDESIYCNKHLSAQKMYFIPFKRNLSDILKKKIKDEIKKFEIGEPIEFFKDILDNQKETGLVSIPIANARFGNLKIKKALSLSRKPFLLSRLSYPYKNIIVLLNGPDPSQALQIGIELSQMFKVPFEVFAVSLPQALRESDEDKRLEKCKSIISDFESIHKQSIELNLVLGNPVVETLSYLSLKQFCLVVTTFDPKTKHHLFQPNPTYLIAKKSLLSFLIIPTLYPDE